MNITENFLFNNNQFSKLNEINIRDTINSISSYDIVNNLINKFS